MGFSFRFTKECSLPAGLNNYSQVETKAPAGQEEKTDEQKKYFIVGSVGTIMKDCQTF